MKQRREERERKELRKEERQQRTSRLYNRTQFYDFMTTNLIILQKNCSSS
jgi:hypothetical protein